MHQVISCCYSRDTVCSQQTHREILVQTSPALIKKILLTLLVRIYNVFSLLLNLQIDFNNLVVNWKPHNWSRRTPTRALRWELTASTSGRESIRCFSGVESWETSVDIFLHVRVHVIQLKTIKLKKSLWGSGYALVPVRAIVMYSTVQRCTSGSFGDRLDGAAARESELREICCVIGHKRTRVQQLRSREIVAQRLATWGCWVSARARCTRAEVRASCSAFTCCVAGVRLHRIGRCRCFVIGRVLGDRHATNYPFHLHLLHRVPICIPHTETRLCVS